MTPFDHDKYHDGVNELSTRRQVKNIGMCEATDPVVSVLGVHLLSVLYHLDNKREISVFLRT